MTRPRESVHDSLSWLPGWRLAMGKENAMNRASPHSKRFVFLGTLVCVLGLVGAPAAHAQAPAPPPIFPAVDGNGVDVTTGALTYSQTDLVIGQPDKGGLAFTRTIFSGTSSFWTNNHNGYING